MKILLKGAICERVDPRDCFKYSLPQHLVSLSFLSVLLLSSSPARLQFTSHQFTSHQLISHGFTPQQDGAHFSSPLLISSRFSSLRFFSSLHINSAPCSCRHCDLSTRKGFKRAGALYHLGCVLLGRQCDLSMRKWFKKEVRRIPVGVFCKEGVKGCALCNML